jgi:hypothetical protein
MYPAAVPIWFIILMMIQGLPVIFCFPNTIAFFCFPSFLFYLFYKHHCIKLPA